MLVSGASWAWAGPPPNHERLRENLTSGCPKGGPAERQRRRERRRREGHPPAVAPPAFAWWRRRDAPQGGPDPQAARARAAVRPRHPGRRLDGVRDDDGRRLRPAPARGSAEGQLRDPRLQRQGDRAADGQPAPALRLRGADLGVHEERDHRHRGSPLLHQPGLRPARHQPGALPGRRSTAARSRAARRSPSSSSRTPPRPRTTARCSRSCARPRWPITSRASGARSGSSATT